MTIIMDGGNIMSKGKLVIVSVQEEYLSIITKQITEILGDKINIKSVTVKDLTMEMLNSDETILLSTNVIFPLVKSILPHGTNCIIAKRCINLINMKKFLDIPLGKNILIINDTKDNTEETIRDLKEIVFEHNYYPYYPDKEIPNFIDYIVTPGETRLIPKGISNVINIGLRVIDIETIIKICQYFNIQYDDSLLIKRYIKSLISLSFENNFIKEDKRITMLQNDVKINKVKFQFDDIITKSKVMNNLVSLAKKISVTDKTVFILGKPGSGRSMIAQAIHNESNFKNGPFISINCSSHSPENLQEKLFGYEKEQKYIPGLFELAKGGSLCIENIGEMSPEIQTKFYQILKTGKIIKTQSEKPIAVNARILITNNVDINNLVNKNLFDLISVYSLRVPSLEERKEDFESLINICLDKYLNCNGVIISDDTMKILKKYSWDGNVRELFDAISIMVSTIFSLNQKVITKECIPYYIKIRNETNKRSLTDNTEIDEKKIRQVLENRGFLKIGIAILEIFAEGKEKNTSYGRKIVIKFLENKGFNITDQQLRLRLKVLNDLDLIIIHQGRAGTTISYQGEKFLKKVKDIPSI